MTSQELEAIVRRAAEASARGERFEDDRVELKSQWPDPIPEMARQLAAQANARGRQEFVWIIGIREKRGVVGAEPRDSVEWLPQLRVRFDQRVCPTLSSHVNLDVEGKNVVALVWDPDEPPYVVELDGRQGNVTREVPWREGEMVRTARRKDLLQVLEPIAAAPILEFIPQSNSWVAARLSDADDGLLWTFRCWVRVVPRGSKPVAVRRNEITCRVMVEGAGELVLNLWFLIRDTKNPNPYLVAGAGEVTFAGSASVELFSDRVHEPFHLVERPLTLKTEIAMRPIGATRAATLEIDWNEPLSVRKDWWGYWVPHS